MATWTSDDLTKIGDAEELEISSLRRDGSLRDPVTIWVVRHGDDLYVRAVNGREGAWFRGTQTQHRGRIEAGGVGRDVTFADVDPGLNDEIDAGYRAKYHRYARNIVDSILTPQARASTTRLVPRAG
ncbi:DUF2255 family protein [Nonomuraea sp. NPDC002799]